MIRNDERVTYKINILKEKQRIVKICSSLLFLCLLYSFGHLSRRRCSGYCLEQKAGYGVTGISRDETGVSGIEFLDLIHFILGQ